MYLVECVDDAVVETEHQRGIGAARLFRIIHDDQAGQQWEPFFASIVVDTCMFDFDHKYRGGVCGHALVEYLWCWRLHDYDTVFAEDIAAKQRYSLICIARDDSADQSVHTFEVHGPSAALQEVIDFGFGCVMGTLADHLLKGIHQVVPVSFINITRYTDYITVFAQVTHVTTKLDL